jgi:GNAT superfamily N-acetyltransferase
MKSTTFRCAEVNDADQLTEIAFAGKAHWGYPPEWMELWRPDLVVTPRYLRTEAISVMEYDGETAGFTGLSTGGKDRQIEHLWLRPKFIGRGFGRLLVGEALRLARKEEVGELFVSSDPNAEGFYLKMGGVRIGREVYRLPGGVQREVPRLVFRLG